MKIFISTVIFIIGLFLVFYSISQEWKGWQIAIVSFCCGINLMGLIDNIAQHDVKDAEA